MSSNNRDRRSSVPVRVFVGILVVAGLLLFVAAGIGKAPAGAMTVADAASTQAKEKSEKKGKVVKGRLIEAPQPVYPEEAKKQGISGTVTVEIVIGRDGTIIHAKAISGPEQLYDVSIEAALKARFEPSTLDGEPVKVYGRITYDFVAEKTDS